MKKLALALVSGAVAFGSPATQASLSTGFYVGANLGYSATTAKNTAVNINNTAVAGSSEIGSNAPSIGLMAGYGMVMNCLYVGGEVSYTFENTKVTSTYGQSALFNTGHMQLKRNGYFNAALRGGYLFTPSTMLYVRLGANIGRWTLTDSLSNPFTNANTARGSKSRLTFVPGIGLETAIHKNIYLRVEYTYEWGPKVTAANNAAGNGNASSSVTSIRTQTGKIGLAYKF